MEGQRRTETGLTEAVNVCDGREHGDELDDAYAARGHKCGCVTLEPE